VLSISSGRFQEKNFSRDGRRFSLPLPRNLDSDLILPVPEVTAILKEVDVYGSGTVARLV
jgi:hypothetical protein